MVKSRIILSSAILLTAAVIWGFAFVAQDMLADTVPPFTVNAVRSLIASAALLPAAAVSRKIKGKPLRETTPQNSRLLWRSGLICGTMLCIAANLQQFGIAAYPHGAPVEAHSGFLTALYILFVPIFGLFLHQKPGKFVFVGALIATVGLYFLCFSGGFDGLYIADIIVLICGVSYAVQILCVDHCIGSLDPIKLSAVQFLICGAESAVLMLVFERPDPTVVLAGWKPLLFLALMSSAGAYTLQIIGQKYATNPTLASILMSMESVFATLGGVIFMGVLPTATELVGCGIMLVAIIVAQLPDRLFKKKET